MPSTLIFLGARVRTFEYGRQTLGTAQGSHPDTCFATNSSPQATVLDTSTLPRASIRSARLNATESVLSPMLTALRTQRCTRIRTYAHCHA